MKSTKTELKLQLKELVLIHAKIKDTDQNGNGSCITCGKFGHRSIMSGGHFIPQSKGDSTRFELDNTNLQCQTCNARCNQGEQYKHGLYIDKHYYEGRAEELHKQSRTPRQRKIWELEEAIEEVENLILSFYRNCTTEEQEKISFYMKKNSDRKRHCKKILSKISLG